MESLRQLAEKDDADPLISFVYAHRLADAGAATEAARPIARAVQRLSLATDPGLAPRIFTLSGYNRIVLGDLQGSEDWLKTSESVHQNDIYVLLGKGIMALRQEHAVEATDALTKATQVAPSRAEAWSRLGEALTLGAEPERAVVAYQHAVALAPQTPQNHVALAEALRTSKRYSEANKEYRIAADLAPKDPNITSSPAIGHAYAARTAEEYQQAVTELNALLTARPDDRHLRGILAGLYMRSGQYAAARRETETWLPHDPRNFVGWHTLALACERSGDQQAATAAYTHYEQLIDIQHHVSDLLINAKLHPNDAEAFLHLAAVLRQAGRNKETLGALRHAAVLRPDDPRIVQALQDAEQAPPDPAPLTLSSEGSNQ